MRNNQIALSISLNMHINMALIVIESLNAVSFQLDISYKSPFLDFIATQPNTIYLHWFYFIMEKNKEKWAASACVDYSTSLMLS